MEIKIIMSKLVSIKKSPFLNQFLSTFFSGLFQVGYISVWAMTSTVLPQITADPNSPVYLTNEEASWFGSLPLLVGIPGSIIGGLLGERLGPHRLQIMFVPILIASNLILMAASWEIVQNTVQVHLLILGSRLVQGILIAILNPAATVYPCEIADSTHRGTFSSLLDVYASIGFLLSYTLGAFLPWYTSVWVMPLITFLPAYIGFALLSPESPAWLVRHGRDEEAKKILANIRASTEEIDEEIMGIKSKLKMSKDIPSHEKHKILFNKPYIMALFVSCFTIVMKELNGHFGIILYAVQIFEYSGTDLNPFLCSVIIGGTRLIFCTVNSAIIHKVNRRTLLVVGNSFGAMATTSIGVFFYLKSCDIDMSAFRWVPMTGLILFMTVYSISIGPVCWTVATEVLPGSIRSIGSGMDLTSWTFSTFIVSKFFLSIKDAFGMHTLFFLFTLGCVVFIIFAFFIIPETRGLSLYEIEQYWETTYGKNNNNNDTETVFKAYSDSIKKRIAMEADMNNGSRRRSIQPSV